ncbi:TnsA endonuclease N-terminal domain-containing protein [Paenibacillus sp. Soil750]|uniref:TnsA endonuclease N-terminal domain-containing protein n=1 Tax=Paenibacillus sp. Soil750 TaxID=1736398 RepID=UPI0006FED3A3|nr:TnsA endonuclease N-terminal domain-containing protein [Paenibacillus sp. Soil750]KRE73918.1 hypothetical protein ASL11_06260 [Paenibacillus sp. Soil750]
MAIKDFSIITQKLHLSEQAVKVIENIRGLPPSRNVRSGKGNVTGFYPSTKMGMTIQFESHTLELAAIYLKEHDETVLEYYDQPPAFPIQYSITDKNNKVKNNGHLYTADFFVIEDDWIGWEEWKHEKDLLQLAIKYPTRYVLDEGIWRCPPAEEYAKKFGLSFRVRTDREIDVTYQRNMIFLDDYMLRTPLTVDTKFEDVLTEIVSNKPGISLKDLIVLHSLDPDEIYTSLLNKSIYLDLFKEPLADSDIVKVFLNKEVAKAFMNVKEVEIERSIHSNIIDIEVGSCIQWDGRKYTFLNIGETTYTLLSEDEKSINVPIAVFKALAKEGLIRGLQVKDSKGDTALNIIKGASKDQLMEANRKFKHVMMYIEESVVPAGLSVRTLRHWVKNFKEAEVQYNNGFLGLLPRTSTQGNAYSRFSTEVLGIINSFIEQYYETPVRRNKSTVYRLLVDALKNQGHIAPSFRTFSTMVDERPKHEQKRKREGHKAAYNSEPVYLELDQQTPRHGDRAFEICHIDHTELDIELVCSRTGKNLGRPWATFLVDAFSRRLLVVYITFDPPSYRTCMMVLRECVKRFSKLPQKLVVDGGKEFHSVYFDSMLAYNKVVKLERPGAKPRFGSVCERLFGTTNTTFVHNLLGNTQATKNVRQVTKEVNPKNLAVWNLGSLFEKLKEWAYEVYDTSDHQAVGLSPRDAFLQSVALTGRRQFAFIKYDETFQMLSLPTTRKGTAKVEPGKGVKMNRFYYWSDKLLHPEIEGKQIPVRYDPYNMGIAYAYFLNQWIMLNSTHYKSMANRTEKELMLAADELRRRQKLHGKTGDEISAAKLVQFLKSAEAEEVLQKQRLKDNEQKSIFEVIKGGKSEELLTKKETQSKKSSSKLVALPVIKNKIDINSEGFLRLEEF